MTSRAGGLLPALRDDDSSGSPLPQRGRWDRSKQRASRLATWHVTAIAVCACMLIAVLVGVLAFLHVAHKTEGPLTFKYGSVSIVWQPSMAKDAAVQTSPPPLQPAYAVAPRLATEEEQMAANKKVIEEADRLSAAAYAAVQAATPTVVFEPAGGPVNRIVLPDSTGKRTLYGTYHVVVTTDTKLYSRWQVLVNYYHYKKVKAADPTGPMGGYTRVLHFNEADNFMHIIPSVVVDQVMGVDDNLSFKPMHRAWGLTQWLMKYHIEEEYIFMSEPDHVFLRQIPLFATPSTVAVWPFWYINCEKPEHVELCQKKSINPLQLPNKSIPRTGNAPTLMTKENLVKVTPLWDRYAREIFTDPDLKGTWGWVQEMYAFSFAVAEVFGGEERVSYHRELMLEPPVLPDSMLVDTCTGIKAQPQECPEGKAPDRGMREAYIIHFTFGQDFHSNGSHYPIVPDFPYHFDKRVFGQGFPWIPIQLPPAGAPAPATELIKSINEAASTYPIWRAYEPYRQLAPPAPPPPPSPPPSAEALKRVAKNNEVKATAVSLSSEAAAASQARMLDRPVVPEGGPLQALDLPAAPSDLPTLWGKYHVVITADDSILCKWMALSSHYSYVKVKAEQQDGPMGGYTRLLHSEAADDLMHLIPTIRVAPLAASVNQGYTTMNRPFAISQWLYRVHIQEQFILMAEPDHIFIRQPPLFATPERMAAFPFWFVNCLEPTLPHCQNDVFNPNHVAPNDVPRTGPAPAMMAKEMLARIAPVWDRTVRAIQLDSAATRVLGYSREMYAFSFAAATVGAPITYKTEFMVQPPFQQTLQVDTCKGLMPQPEECPGGNSSSATWRNVSMVHFAAALDLDSSGRPVGKGGVFHWDKRDYRSNFPTFPIPQAPAGTPESVTRIFAHINEVAANTPLWQAYMPLQEA